MPKGETRNTKGLTEKRENDRWEISQDRIKLGEKVGEGAFGNVYIAEVDIKGHPVVAAKKLKDQPADDEINEFLSEIEMLKKVGCHPNVVELVGCCTMEKPYYALLEYAPNGDLLKHLRMLRESFRSNQIRNNSQTRSSEVDSKIMYSGNRRKSTPAVRPSESGTDYTFLGSDDKTSLNYISGSIVQTMFATTASVTPASVSSFATDMEFTYPLTNRTDMSDSAYVNSIPAVEANEYCQAPTVQGLDPKVLHMYALQIARGMEHLEKKQITHRDLAARNVLIDEKGNLKVSDLGLSRTGIYVLSSRYRKVPLRWLSTEAIEMSRYSNKSDVWAYAVLLWEIGTLGAFPYPAVQDQDILQYLLSGQRLDHPKTVSDEIYQTMKKCWSDTPSERPDFSDLVKLLEKDDTKTKAYKDIYTLTGFKLLPMESIHEIASEAV